MVEELVDFIPELVLVFEYPFEFDIVDDEEYEYVLF
jgi:hypothetical protein